MTLRSLPRVLFTLLAASIAFVAASAGALAAQPRFNAEIAGTPMPADSTPGTIAITVRTCPVGYDPTKATADPKTDCRRPAGDTMFAVARNGLAGPSASTGTSGDAPQESTVTFSDLTPGRLTIAATAPVGIGTAFIGACASTARDFSNYPISPFAWAVNGRIAIDLKGGESLACNWYQIES